MKSGTFRRCLIRGFDLREATNGEKAIELWKDWKPHLIWMHMRMPVLDGYGATKRIKNEELRMRNQQLIDDFEYDEILVLLQQMEDENILL